MGGFEHLSQILLLNKLVELALKLHKWQVSDTQYMHIDAICSYEMCIIFVRLT